MSRAFEGLGLVAAFVLAVIVLVNIIKGGAEGLAKFIESYYVVIGIILFIIDAAIGVFIYTTMKSEGSKSNPVAHSITAVFAIAQNAAFLVYGLYRALTAHPDDAFLIVLAIGGFIFVYIVDAGITFASIGATMELSFGWIFPIMVFVAGGILIKQW